MHRAEELFLITCDLRSSIPKLVVWAPDLGFRVYVLVFAFRSRRSVFRLLLEHCLFISICCYHCDAAWPFCNCPHVPEPSDEELARRPQRPSSPAETSAYSRGGAACCHRFFQSQQDRRSDGPLHIAVGDSCRRARVPSCPFQLCSFS